jgi:hypothetical protein
VPTTSWRAAMRQRCPAMLGDVQALISTAMVSREAEAELAPLLVGGRDARLRFAIHQRHYQASLVRSVMETFPATAWLAGSTFVNVAAAAFVCAHPPQSPCIGEYGVAFPQFLASCHDCPGAYVRDFAELEWCVGRIALAVDAPPLAAEDLAAMDPVRLASSSVVFQAGVGYIESRWPIDELLQFYVTDSAPDQFHMSEMDVRIEVRGARGEFRLRRLPPADFAFRQGLHRSVPLIDAAELALEADPAFDAGAALSSIIAEHLVTAIEGAGEAA